MSYIGSLLGVGGGNKGLDYQAQNAPIQQAVTPEQAAAQAAQAQGGLSQQQAFINAVQGQGGLQNQSNVFAQQQALANQLGQMAQGQGPNPAKDQLAQATAANTANQAALMAGQRGAGANAGLIARQAAQQGAATQQQSVGQAATLQAQQQIAAQNALAQQQAAMQQVAGQQIANQQGGLNALNSGAQNLYGQSLGAIGNQNNAQVANSNNMNTTNAVIQSGLAGKQADFGYGLISKAGQGIAAAAMAQGGMVASPKAYADGGQVAPAPTDGPRSRFGQFVQGFNAPAPVDSSLANATSQAQPATPQPVNTAAQAGNSLGSLVGQFAGSMGGSGGGASAVGADSAAGGTGAIAAGAPAEAAMLAFSKGAVVPGQAKVKGDSYANDKVPAVLSPGEIVLPRSVTQSKDPAKNAAKFVQAVLARQNMKGGSK